MTRAAPEAAVMCLIMIPNPSFAAMEIAAQDAAWSEVLVRPVLDLSPHR